MCISMQLLRVTVSQSISLSITIEHLDRVFLYFSLCRAIGFLVHWEFFGKQLRNLKGLQIYLAEESGVLLIN